MHTSVAALNVRNDPLPEISITKPIVLTNEETSASAAIIKSARPLCLALEDQEIGGRIGGAFRFAKITADDKLSHVDPNIFFLPAGRSLTVSTDEAVALWPGDKGLSTDQVLAGVPYRIEPTDGVQVHGPVFVSQVKSRERFLHIHEGFQISAEDAPMTNSPVVAQALPFACALCLFFGVNLGSAFIGDASNAEMLKIALPMLQLTAFIVLITTTMRVMIAFKNSATSPDQAISSSAVFSAQHNQKIRALAAQHGVDPTVITAAPRAQVAATPANAVPQGLN